MRSPILGASFFLALAFTACMKEEIPVPAHPRDAAETMQTCMGAGYAEQFWVDLSTRQVVATNPRSAWDLAIESGDDGWRIWLNGAKLMTVWNAGALPIDQPTDTAGMGLGRRIDAPSGHPDSTAFGDWRGRNDLYVVDLGYTPLGQHIGLRNVKVSTDGAGNIVMHTAMVNGTGVQEHVIQRDPTRHRVCFSFQHGAVPIEPPAGEWDIVLTQYTHQFYEPFMPYLVAGVLVAPDVRVARITTASPAAIMLSDTVAFPFSGARNAIGYDWKEYSFDTGSYTIDPDLGFVLRDGHGYFHRLRFIDFYGSTGQVGCPTWEVEGL